MKQRSINVGVDALHQKKRKEKKIDRVDAPQLETRIDLKRPES
jgi:hypothetical protein